MYRFAQEAPLYPLQTSLEPAISQRDLEWARKLRIQYSFDEKQISMMTWLRTSESEADDTKVIARPFVPNLPALPTCHGFDKKARVRTVTFYPRQCTRK